MVVEESNVVGKVEVNIFPVEVEDNSSRGSLDITAKLESVECTEENDDREVESLCAARK